MDQGPTSSIFVMIRIAVWIEESEVRVLYSLDNRKKYRPIFVKFYGELGCDLETDWLHCGDDPHNYVDTRVRSGSRSGSGN